jgi:hypothetical protein
VSFTHAQATAKGTTNGSSTSTSAVLTNNPANTDTVCVGTFWSDTTANPPASFTVADANSNNYTKTTNSPSTVKATTCGSAFIFYLLNASGASKTVTATYTNPGASGAVEILADDFTVTGGTVTFNQDSAGNGNGATVNTPSVVAAVGDLQYCYAAVASSISTVNSPWTQGGIGTDGSASGYILSAASNQVLNMTQSVNPSDWDSMGASFTIGAATSIPSVTTLMRSGRGPGQGPTLRRAMPQQFPVPLPPATETTQSPASPFRPGRGPGMGPLTLRRAFQRPGADLVTAITVALTGASATFHAGTLIPNNAVPLTGAKGTFTPGTLVAAHTQALTGQKSTFSPGTLGVTHANPLAGQRATFSPGVVSSALNVPLAGSRATFGAGTVTPITGLFVALTGASATFAAGVLTPSVTGQVVPTRDVTTVGGGGITQWTLQIPRIPEKKRITFVRNMENRDREDLADIVSFLRRL